MNKKMPKQYLEVFAISSANVLHVAVKGTSKNSSFMTSTPPPSTKREGYKEFLEAPLNKWH